MIGMSDNKLRHSRAVANKCYELAKKYNFGDDFAKKMYLLGFIHDIGYDFVEDPTMHAEVSADFLNCLFNKPANFDESKEYLAIKEHSQIPTKKSIEWEILTEADMNINSKGEDVGVEKRLEDILERYGENSIQYQKAKQVIKLF